MRSILNNNIDFKVCQCSRMKGFPFHLFFNIWSHYINEKDHLDKDVLFRLKLPFRSLRLSAKVSINGAGMWHVCNLWAMTSAAGMEPTLEIRKEDYLIRTIVTKYYFAKVFPAKRFALSFNPDLNHHNNDKNCQNIDKNCHNNNKLSQ